MFRKSLLLLSTVAILVPSVPSFADSKDERREKYRKESTAKPQARRQQAQRHQAQKQQVQRQRTRQSEPRRERQRAAQPQHRERQALAPDRRDIASPNRAQYKAATRANREARADRRARNVRAHSASADDRRQRNAVVARADRERARNVQQTREARDRSVNRHDRPVRARTPDRRDVMQANRSFSNNKSPNGNRVPVNYGQRRHDGNQYWNSGRDRGRHVSSDRDRRHDGHRARGGNDHRSRGDHRDRDRNYHGKHSRYRDYDRGRRNDWHYRYRDRPKTRIYIGLGTYPYRYWGRPYYGYYSYSDWPFYSGYWHARAHWAWHTHHSHYHYGDYCPGLSHGYQTSYHYDEPYYAGYSSNAGNEVAGTILGGVVGGILGSEIDGGRNRTAGIVIGSLLGATVGNSIAKNSNSRTVSSNYRYTADYYDDDPTIYHYENEGYAPPREEVRKCIEYDVRGGNYVCRRWTVEYR